MNCPVCNNMAVKVVRRLYDDRYGYPGLFPLFNCLACEHIFLQTNLSQNELRVLYNSYYPRKTFDIDSYRPHKEQKGIFAWLNGLDSAAFRWVPANVRVLDVGCGFGEAIGYHKGRGCDVYGVEADENIRRVAEKFGYKIHVGLFDDKAYESDFFDVVTMDQVIEHMIDPISSLQGVARVLKPGGKVILSTPNARGWGAGFFGSRWINWHAPYHMQFFSGKSIRLAAEKAGLELRQVRTVTNSEWLNLQWMHLVMFPKLNQPSLLWSADMQRARLWQKLSIKLLRVMHQAKINHLLTRFFDALSLGDNFVFVFTKR